MEPVTAAIMAALSTFAKSSIEAGAKESVNAAFGALKTAVAKRWGADAQAVRLIDEAQLFPEDSPQGRSALLDLSRLDLAKDPDIAQAARALKASCEPGGINVGDIEANVRVGDDVTVVGPTVSVGRSDIHYTNTASKPPDSGKPSTTR